jgi:serine/threonine protein kinase
MPDPDLILGDFRIERRLGAGGMGVVYLARQVSLNRLVALKSLGSPLTDSDSVARFRRAAQRCLPGQLVPTLTRFAMT